MAEKQNNLVEDFLFDFSKGMNSGRDPFALEKDQLAFALNATVRGDFATNRPPVQIQNLPAAVWQTINAVGIFQGACYCAPDTGQQFLIAQIGGRLFTFTPDVNDTTVVVAEVTIPGDPNPSGLPQAWLWQAERWIIINNGVNNPIFYDSTTNVSRRSVIASTSQATTFNDGTTASQFITPAIGGTVTVTLAALGNIAAFINQAVQLVEYDNSSPPQVTATTSYEVTSVGGAATTYNVTLKNLGDAVGAIQGAGSGLSIQPANLGNIISESATFTVSPTAHAKLTLTMSSPVPAYLIAGNAVSINGDANWNVVSISSDRITLKLQYATAGFDVFVSPTWPPAGAVGYPVYAVANTQPNTTVGILNAPFTAPATGASVSATLVANYTGALNQILFLNNKQYQVTAFNTVVGSSNNTVTLLNLNDSRLGHIFNQVTIPISITATQIFNFPELPPGRMGTYCQGRVGMSLTDAISFILGDIVGGSAGSPAYNFRDAVLKTSESSLLANGGSFRVPSNLGQITAMKTMAQADASLGQGALMIVTPGGVFSFNAPADRTLWATLTTPILTETLIGLGGLSQNAAIVCNGDLIFRAVDGIRSLKMAKREYYSWGNTPISFEMARVLDNDNVAGLPYASAVQIDNRMLMTCVPTQGAQGVYHQGLIALNFDPISSLQGKEDSVYDGLWTGLNVLQLVEGQFSGVHRCFAFTYNTTLGKIELYEILKSGQLDNGTTPMTWSFETPTVFSKNVKGKNVFDLCSLEDCEFYIQDVKPGQTVNFTVEYQPDFSNCWFPWHSFSFCNDPSSTQPTYGARLGLGKPPSGSTTGSNSIAANFGRWFQLRFTIQGHCVFMGLKILASLQPQSEYAKVIRNGNGTSGSRIAPAPVFSVPIIIPTCPTHSFGNVFWGAVPPNGFQIGNVGDIYNQIISGIFVGQWIKVSGYGNNSGWQ